MQNKYKYNKYYDICSMSFEYIKSMFLALFLILVVLCIASEKENSLFLYLMF